MTPRDPALSPLLINVLVLPGLGSWLAGRRGPGAGQALLALAGFALTLVWLWSYGSDALRAGSLPAGLGRNAGAGLFGLALFAGSWLWSLLTGLALLRRSRERA